MSKKYPKKVAILKSYEILGQINCFQKRFQNELQRGQNFHCFVHYFYQILRALCFSVLQSMHQSSYAFSKLLCQNSGETIRQQKNACHKSLRRIKHSTAKSSFSVYNNNAAVVDMDPRLLNIKWAHLKMGKIEHLFSQYPITRSLFISILSVNEKNFSRRQNINI